MRTGSPQITFCGDFIFHENVRALVNDRKRDGEHTEQKRDEILKRMLETPPQPHKSHDENSKRKTVKRKTVRNKKSRQK